MPVFGSGSFGSDVFAKERVGESVLWDRLPYMHRLIDEDNGGYLERFLKVLAGEVEDFWDRLEGIKSAYEGKSVQGRRECGIKLDSSKPYEWVEDSYFGRICRLYIDQANTEKDSVQCIEPLDRVEWPGTYGWVVRKRIRDWGAGDVYIDVKVPVEGSGVDIVIWNEGLLRYLAYEYGVELNAGEMERWQRRLVQGIWGLWPYREVEEGFKVRARMAGWYVCDVCGLWRLDSDMRGYLPAGDVVEIDGVYYTCKEGRWIRFDDIRSDVTITDEGTSVGLLDRAWIGEDLSLDFKSTGLYFSENVLRADGVSDTVVGIDSVTPLTDAQKALVGIGQGYEVRLTIDESQREIPIAYVTPRVFSLVRADNSEYEYVIVLEAGYIPNGANSTWVVWVDSDTPPDDGYDYKVRYWPERGNECWWCKGRDVLVRLLPTRDVTEWYGGNATRIWEAAGELGKHMSYISGATTRVNVDLCLDEMSFYGGSATDGTIFRVNIGKEFQGGLGIGGWLYVNGDSFSVGDSKEIAHFTSGASEEARLEVSREAGDASGDYYRLKLSVTNGSETIEAYIEWQALEFNKWLVFNAMVVYVYGRITVYVTGRLEGDTTIQSNENQTTDVYDVNWTFDYFQGVKGYTDIRNVFTIDVDYSNYNTSKIDLSVPWRVYGCEGFNSWVKRWWSDRANYYDRRYAYRWVGGYRDMLTGRVVELNHGEVGGIKVFDNGGNEVEMQSDYIGVIRPEAGVDFSDLYEDRYNDLIDCDEYVNNTGGGSGGFTPQL